MTPVQDVVVIGAGVIGISIALELHAWGHDVKLMDPQGIGQDAFLGNAGRAPSPKSFPWHPRASCAKASCDVICAFGHGHFGLTQSAATGEIVADLVAGRDPAISVAPLLADRFGAG